MQVPKRKEGKYTGGPADDFLTHSAIARLKHELERLEKQDRPKAVEDLRAAREMGDLSENFAYSEAKARLARIDGRVFGIKERLKFAVPIEEGAGAGGAVRVGATVVVEVNGKTKEFRILGTQESDPSRGRISYHSPLGAALMGKKAGDVAAVSANGKELTYRIVEVR